MVDRLVASGRYQNASEVLRAGLRMVEELESTYTTKMNDLRAAIDAGEEAGSSAPLLKSRSDIRPGIATYPIARKGKASPHQFYLRIEKDTKEPAIVIIRALHQRMDPEG